MCRVRAPGGALAGTVSDIKLPGVVLFLCVSNESRKMERIKFGESLLSCRILFFLFYAANAASARRNEVQSSCALPYLKAHSAKSLIKPETSLKHKSNLFSPEKYNLKITTNLHISVLKLLLKN